jgi:hypothetical protein
VEGYFQPELICGDAEQVAQQLPVSGADSFDAAFPLGDHVGVDRNMLPVLHPGQVREAIRHLLLRPAELEAVLAQPGAPSIACHC